MHGVVHHVTTGCSNRVTVHGAMPTLLTSLTDDRVVIGKCVGLTLLNADALFWLLVFVVLFGGVSRATLVLAPARFVTISWTTF